MKLDVQDQGGHGRFVTPDGRKLEITLHSDDWPFAAERDALILVVQDQGSEIQILSLLRIKSITEKYLPELETELC